MVHTKKKRMPPKGATLRELYLYSGNICAFKNCRTYLLDDDGNWIGEVAHIEAAEDNGPRANPKLTPDERRQASNLMLLCRNHHQIVDSSPEKYTVEELRNMKAEHEKWLMNGLSGMLDKILDDSSDSSPITLPQHAMYFALGGNDPDMHDYDRCLEKFAKHVQKLPIPDRRLLVHLIRRSDIDPDYRGELMVDTEEVFRALVTSKGKHAQKFDYESIVYNLKHSNFLDCVSDYENPMLRDHVRLTHQIDGIDFIYDIYYIAKAKAGEDGLPDLPTLESIFIDLDFSIFGQELAV